MGGVKSGESRVSQKEEREKEESIMVNPDTIPQIRTRGDNKHNTTTTHIHDTDS